MKSFLVLRVGCAKLALKLILAFEDRHARPLLRWARLRSAAALPAALDAP
jgi:hypothetical protein